jgi:GntR family transcriptional regulator
VYWLSNALGGDVLILVDHNSGVPIYRQIMEQVRFQVAAGLARAGDELPSTRALSEELGVNPMTVSKAYAALEEEGLVQRRPGLPLVVRQRSAAEEDAARAEQLRQLLEPAARAAAQLGLGAEEVLERFRSIWSELAKEEVQER